MSKRPTIRKGPASSYAGPNETIIEFSDGAGNGGLISLRSADDGRLIVELYRVDEGVEIRAPLTRMPTVPASDPPPKTD